MPVHPVTDLVQAPRVHAARCRQRLTTLTPTLLATAVAAGWGTTWAGPEGGSVAQGLATIETSGTRTTIQQQSRTATLDWRRFNIGAGESVVFHQPGREAVALNRIADSQPSRILGSLSANGQVFLVNPNGVIFGSSAQVNVGGLVASTLATGSALGDASPTFSAAADAPAGSVVNQGRIEAAPGGYVALLGARVSNQGVIATPQGSAALAAGQRVTLRLQGQGLLGLDVEQGRLDALVENHQLIQADGGQVLMSTRARDSLLAGVVNQTGVVQARSVTAQDGVIVLGGGQLSNTGTLDAQGRDGATGGRVDIAGGFVALGGRIDASGRDGGQVTVRAGGDLSLADTVLARGLQGRGGSLSYHAAGQLTENDGSRHHADGTTEGGRITVQADAGLLSSGQYSAVGTVGAGGRIDLSGRSVRLLSARLDAHGPAQGGRVRVGGDYLGGRASAATTPDADLFLTRWGGDDTPRPANALQTFINDASFIDVSSSAGRGGTAVVWSDKLTTQLGRIDARGATGGGAVELSSAERLQRAGLAGVEVGAGGRLLLDPTFVTIGDGAATSGWSYAAILGHGYAQSTAPDASITQGFGASVALNAAGDRMAVGRPLYSGTTLDCSNARCVQRPVEQAGAVSLYSFTDGNFGGARLEATLAPGARGGKNIDLLSLENKAMFGKGVALNAVGDRLAVGASGLNGGAGGVYLFSFADGSFNGGRQQAVLRPDVPDALFGTSVALNAAGNRLAVGAAGAAGSTGAVHVFDFAGQDFSTPDLKLTLPLGSRQGLLWLGSAVALNGRGDRLAMGAQGSGEVYLVGLDASGQLTKAWEPLRGGLTDFGASLALNAAGDRLAVGSAITADVHLFDFAADGAGARGTEIPISFPQEEAGVAPAQSDLGSGVALNAAGSRLVVGVPGQERVMMFGLPTGAGAAQPLGRIDRAPGIGLDLAALKAEASFGSGLALSADGRLLAVGSSGDAGADGQSPFSGAVRLFSFQDGDFRGARLQATVGKGYAGGNNIDVAGLQGGQAFGASVALNATGDRLAVGAPGDGGATSSASATGAVYLFSFADPGFGGGQLQAKLGLGYAGGKNVDVSGLDLGDRFGWSVALNGTGDRLAVGAIGGRVNATGENRLGAVRLFAFADRDFGSGTLSSTLGASNVAGLRGSDSFGAAVALNAAGDRLAVGSPGDKGPGGNGPVAGAVTLFSFSGGHWAGARQEAKIGQGYTGPKDLDLARLQGGGGFGTSVALDASGRHLAVGAPFDAGTGTPLASAGAVHLIDFGDGSFGGARLAGTIGNGYTANGDLNLPGLSAREFFGTSVALNAAGSRLAVGAIGNKGQAGHLDFGGAVRLFTDLPVLEDTLQIRPPITASFSQPLPWVTVASHPLVAKPDSGGWIESAEVSQALSGADIERHMAQGASLTIEASHSIILAMSRPLTLRGGGTLTLNAGDIRLYSDLVLKDSHLVANAHHPFSVQAAYGPPPAEGLIQLKAGLLIDGGTARFSATRFSALPSDLKTQGTGRWSIATPQPAAPLPVAPDYVQYASSSGWADLPAELGNAVRYAAIPAPLSGRLAGVIARPYDGTTTASLAWQDPKAQGALAGDHVELKLPDTGRYDDKNVGDGKPVTVDGIGIASATTSYPTTYGPAVRLPVYGYAIAPLRTTGRITPRQVTVGGLSAVDKVYDGSAAATLTGTASVAALAGDSLALNGSLAAAFADKNVGKDKQIQLSGLSLTGTDAGNYALALPSLRAAITPRPVAPTGLEIADKVYDGTTAASLRGTPSVAALPGDDLGIAGSVTAAFADKSAGSRKPVTLLGLQLTGADAANYELQPAAPYAASITPRGLSVQGMVAQDKVFDGLSDATLAGIPTITPLAGDSVTVTGTPTARFADSAIGTAKPVAVTGYALTGTDAGNYTLAQPSGLQASIFPGVSAAPSALALIGPLAPTTSEQRQEATPAEQAAPGPGRRVSAASSADLKSSGLLALVGAGLRLPDNTATPSTDKP